jgi:radical SAM superfamily enzyme YgiQ (UPF0313 family)
MEEPAMEMAQTKLVVRHRSKIAQVDAQRVRFSPRQCFARDGGPADLDCLRTLAAYLALQPELAVAIDGDAGFLTYLLNHFPALKAVLRCVIVEKYSLEGSAKLEGLALVSAEEVPEDVQTVFLADTQELPRVRMRQWLPNCIRQVEPDVLAEMALHRIPARAWTAWARDVIYPMALPDIEFQSGLDLLVIDCPARNLGLMPNGLGYVHNALKEVDVRFQTCDVDILIYHRFHIRRLCDEGGAITLPGGRVLPTDPWQAEHYDLWTEDALIDYFEPEIEEIVAKVVAARPKILGLSIHGCNERFSARVVQRVKARLPEIIILVGGYSCYSPDIGLRGFPLADYMCIGEADLTVGPLVERLAKGERPLNTPGVMSRFDPPAAPFLPAPMVHDLDLLDYPRYEWSDLDVYQNYNGYQLTPIIASRGCRWSRCTFCAERFYWRIRSAENFVDELEWLIERGCRLFMFNESDLNGKPEAVLEICDEILRRGLKVRLTGQLRIHKKCDLAYFKKLRQAGFVALRFGIDAFSENALRLQKKGYTTATVSQNLRDCWQAGIFSEVNWVIGVPGETDADIDESIALILQNKPYIGRLANINPLILSTGSVYWMEPEKHNIHFRGDKEELYRKHPRAIPAHLWYSTEPTIDEKVRKQRFERIVLALHEGKFNVGAWANRIIDDVKYNRDCNRAGPKTDEESAANSIPVREKMNAGVGGMSKPTASKNGALEFNADARSSAYVFRAGSSLPEDPSLAFRSDVYLLEFDGAFFAIDPAAWAVAFTKPAHGPGSGQGITVDLRRQCTVTLAKTKNAVAELVHTIGTYNIVSYDSRFYGVPQCLSRELSQKLLHQLRTNGSNPKTYKRPLLVRWLRRAARIGLDWIKKLWPGERKPLVTTIPWGDVVLEGLPGIISGTKINQIIDEVERRVGNSARIPSPAAKPCPNLPIIEPPLRKKAPQRLGTLESYQIVEYEGWYYGIPTALGDIRLEEVDVIEMPGVIRDVSREVVEGEIREMSQLSRHSL